MRVLHPLLPASLPLVLLLTACGGGGGGGGDTATAPEAAANPPAVSAPNTPTTPSTSNSDGTGEAPPANGVDAASVSAAADAAAWSWTPAAPVESAPATETAAAPAAVTPALSAAPAQVFTAQAVTLSDSQRAAAATATAQSTSNPCNAVRPFYWEIGTRDGSKVSGSVAAAGSTTTYIASTPITVASASKWIYATYAVQKLGGVLSTADRKYLTMTSGYATFNGCQKGDTVGTCEARPENSVYTASADGKFDYSGGHMQRHATMVGLSPYNGVGVAKEIRASLGTDLGLLYSTQVAAGATISSADYAKILRKIMSGQLKMGGLLGTTPVCTNPRTCSQAVLTPVPMTESWHYSIGHWVEDDPTVGDGAFSSAGAFGFYPWIDATKTYYGVLGRFDPVGTSAGYASAQCGRLIRKAYVTGVAS